MADVLGDLAIVPVTSSDSNYFLRKVTGLKIDKSYSFKFQWVYEDGSLSDWSAGYQTFTPAESVPGSPTATVPTTNASYIPVTLPAFPANAKRVDVYVIGGTYGTGRVADSFLQAGTKSIAAGAGTYQVSLITVSPSGINGSPSSTFTITVTDPTANIQSPAASKTPSIPTVSSVLGAIQLSWDGKQADGTNQPYGFNAAKVYVGTSDGFVPSSSNQVDVLNFANGQNTLAIGVGTLVNGVAMTYGTDYYVKIATTNGTDTSAFVSASGNPKQIGKVGSGDIVSVLADQITTGTLSATSTITVGTTAGKHLKLAGTGDPLVIYGSGGVSNPVLSFNGNKLTIAGDGAFTGSLTGASGTFGPVTIGTSGISSTNFSIANDGSASFNGILTASGGSIGGWTINSTVLRSSSLATTVPRIELDQLTPQLLLVGTGGTISMSPQSGIVGPNVTIAGNTGPGFSLSPNGTAVLRGEIYANTGVFTGEVNAASGSITGNLSVSGNINITSGSLYTQNIGALFGGVRVNGSNAAYEFLDGDNNVAGQMYTFNSGNEIIIQTGNSREGSVGYPSNGFFQTMNNSGWSVGYALANGTSTDYFNFQAGPNSGSPSIITSASITTVSNDTANGSYHRNISAGTGAQSTGSSNNGNGFPAYIGDIYIQY
jgi:hypothetical protein